MTDQMGGWILIQIEGKASKSIFEKLISVNLEEFIQGKVIRVSINKINCFVRIFNLITFYMSIFVLQSFLYIVVMWTAPILN